MLKSITLTVASTLTILAAMPAGAIAPGFQQLKTCQGFTATKYRVNADQLRLNIGQRTPTGYYIDWRVNQYNAAGYCFVTNRNATTQWVVRSGPRPEQVSSVGPNERIFNGLPGYGNVIVNRGQTVIGDKQYFLVRPINTGRSYKWYARCANNSDQVYDHTGKYVGYDRRMTVMFPYVCEVSPLKPKPPVPPRPPLKPQPR
jgi:hypothetical protein